MNRSSTVRLLAITFILLVWLPLFANGVVVTLDNPPATIDFNDLVVGSNAMVSLGPDIKIRALKEPLNVVPDPLLPALPVIFDSSNPGDVYRQNHLGSPYVFLVVIVFSCCCRLLPLGWVEPTMRKSASPSFSPP
jgi:hypothetical protein